MEVSGRLYSWSCLVLVILFFSVNHNLSSFATLSPWSNEMSVTITHSESEKKRSPNDWNMTPCDDSFTSSAPSVGTVVNVVSNSIIGHLLAGFSVVVWATASVGCVFVVTASTMA
jgi:hypothetical protein